MYIGRETKKRNRMALLKGKIHTLTFDWRAYYQESERAALRRSGGCGTKKKN